MQINFLLSANPNVFQINYFRRFIFSKQAYIFIFFSRFNNPEVIRLVILYIYYIYKTHSTQFINDFKGYTNIICIVGKLHVLLYFF